MISWRKEYYFKPDTLELEESPITIRKLLYKAGRFILVNTLLATFALIIYLHYFETPQNLVHKKELATLLARYDSLDAKIEHQRQNLLANISSSDKIYREVLGLDSLTSSIRLAGIGGTEPNELLNVLHNDIKRNLLLQYLNFSSQVSLQKESFDIIEEKASLHSKMLECIPGILPVSPDPHIWISSYFGGRNDPFTSVLRKHKGIDIVGPQNTKIYATADGIVTLADYSRTGYGNEIVIDHGFGYNTRYAHLNKLIVKEGDTIRRGDLIGLMGNTGRSTGTHLHYEVRLHNRAIDPMLFFEDDLTPEEYALITARNEEKTN